MINAANIAAYIRFLYQQKYHTTAPEEVIQSWSQVPEDEIKAQLSALYQHWGLDNAEAQRYEATFVNQVKSTATVDQFFAPPPSPAQTTPPPSPHTPSPAQAPSGAYYQSAPPPRRNNPWKTISIVVVLILLAAGGYLVYQLYQNQQQTSTTSTFITDTTYEAKAPVQEPEPEPMVPELPLNEVDEVNMDAIYQLLAAEDRQDLELILSYYAPYMERYWDISYPTQEQLQKRYEASWQKVADGQNVIKEVRKVAPNTYDADVQYSYHDIKKETDKTVNSTLRFVFNEDHQITQVYKLK